MFTILDNKTPVAKIQKSPDGTGWLIQYLPKTKRAIMPHLPLRAEPYLFPRFPRFILSLIPKGQRLNLMAKGRHLDENDLIGVTQQCLGGRTIGRLNVVVDLAHQLDTPLDELVEAPQPGFLHVSDLAELEVKDPGEQAILGQQINRLASANGLGGSWPKAFLEGPDASYLLKKYPAFDVSGKQIAECEAASLQAFNNLRPKEACHAEVVGDCLIVERFDRDFETKDHHYVCHLADLDEEQDIFKGSFEKLCNNAIKVDPKCGQKLLTQILFCWVIGDSDHHSENFAFRAIMDDERKTPQWELAPLYDNLPSHFFVADKEFIALTVNGRKNRLALKDWEGVASICGENLEFVADFLQKATIEAKKTLLPKIPEHIKEPFKQHLATIALIAQGKPARDAELEVKKDAITSAARKIQLSKYVKTV